MTTIRTRKRCKAHGTYYVTPGSCPICAREKQREAARMRRGGRDRMKRGGRDRSS